ncbi:MAG TPA: NAD(P)H-dependent oxidoreductase subunit E [bacterium]|nr:NAD(P)H-dependent oxidoreductase subunit E [bacterium]
MTYSEKNLRKKVIMSIEEDFIDKSIKKHGNILIPVLQDMQEYFKYLPEENLIQVAKKLQIPLIDVYGIATFYQSFSLVPKGDHIIVVCLGTACYIHTGKKMVEVLTNELNIEPGSITKDKKFSLETVNCLGCCAIGPIVLIDGTYYGEMTPKKIIKLIKTLKREKND